jgi:integrase
MMKRARPDFKLPDAIFPPENMTRVRHLTPQQYDRVFKKLAELHGPMLADMAELALLGVMRQGDVRLLKRSYVRVTERVILLPHTKGGPRTVRLSPQALVIVKRALARKPRHDFVFSNPRNAKPYSRVHVSRCWRDAARAAGLDDFTFHDLRHHGPTLLVNKGANDAMLQAIGGWKSPKMVKRYAHVLTPEVDRYLTLIGNGKRAK